MFLELSQFPVKKAAREPSRHEALIQLSGHMLFPYIACKARYRGGAYGKRVPFPHGRATVIGDERQQDEPLAGIPLGRCWLVDDPSVRRPPSIAFTYLLRGMRSVGIAMFTHLTQVTGGF